MDDKNITTFFREAPPREAQNTVAKRHRAERGTMRSALSRWFGERTEDGVSSRRMRKVAIVAVARKLAVALWKFLGHGELPEGAAKADEKGAAKAA